MEKLVNPYPPGRVVNYMDGRPVTDMGPLCLEEITTPMHMRPLDWGSWQWHKAVEMEQMELRRAYLDNPWDAPARNAKRSISKTQPNTGSGSYPPPRKNSPRSGLLKRPLPVEQLEFFPESDISGKPNGGNKSCAIWD